MLVSIKAIRLSGTAALLTAGVAAGLGKGVGVGLGGVVCGRVWPTTAIAVVASKMNTVRISLFITSPGSCSRISIHRLHRLRREGKSWIGQNRFVGSLPKENGAI